VQRLFYEQFRGPIPEGMELHHLCDNTNCVNPTPLLALTSKEHHALHYRSGPDVLSPSQIAARNACIVALARERRQRDPQKARALARAKYARRIAAIPEATAPNAEPSRPVTAEEKTISFGALADPNLIG
jgi:hypothetical protein